MTRSKLLNDLNPQQLQAVTHKTGPLLIIAGAGTGKTKVITHRIARLIEQKLAKPAEILALTFTEKAAAEMEQRVDILVPYGFVDTWISTFHAFGDRLLRDFALDLGLPANFKVLTQTEQAIFLRQNLFAFDLKYFRPLANPTAHIEALIKHFSRLKDELIAPETYLSLVQTKSLKLEAKSLNEEKIEAEKTLELANAYQTYCDLMLQNGNLDFGDQIFLAYKLLQENPKILKECQQKFKYILVDEFQDTNYAQNELVKLLAGGKANITVVGDDDQAIYRFRGAAISNILDFKKTYPRAKQIVLNQNYRSTQEILHASYKLIQHNNPDRLEIKNQINKKLLSPTNGNLPQLLHCDTLSSEANLVVKTVQQLKAKSYQLYRDFAILVRANNHAEPFIQNLNLAGIPYVFSGASGLFQQLEIKMLIAFLKCLVYTDDNLAFHQLATSELYNIDQETMSQLYTLSRRTNRPISDLISASLEVKSEFASAIGSLDPAKGGYRDVPIKRSSFDDKRASKINSITDDIAKYRQQINSGVGELLYNYLAEKKYLKNLLKNPSVENEIKIHNIAKFFERISQFNHATNERGVLAFLENLEMILEFSEEIVTSDIDPDLDAVNILTVHAAKGLEWPVVFIANCVVDRFPSRNWRDPLPIPEELIKEQLPIGDFHLQEERRLFYVACTRAKEQLYLTAADDYGGKRSKKISQFVLELLDEPNPEKLKHKLSPLEKIEQFKKLPHAFVKLPEKFTSKILKLSRQQVDDYYTCPKKFYFAHLIRLPLLENHQLMYGTAIHQALNRYFVGKMNNKALDLNRLLLDYQQAFKNVGFITIEHEKQRYQQGLETLTRFFHEDSQNPEIPAKVEESFEFIQGKAKINGRFDLVYHQLLSASESNNQRLSASFEIRDVKTSDVQEQKDADRRIRESTQMMIYALAWQKQYKQIPKTTLFFIESGLKGERVFTQKELDQTKQMINDVVSGLKAQNFFAQPDRFSCRYCPYKDICPQKYQGV